MSQIRVMAGRIRGRERVEPGQPLRARLGVGDADARAGPCEIGKPQADEVFILQLDRGDVARRQNASIPATAVTYENPEIPAALQIDQRAPPVGRYRCGTSHRESASGTRSSPHRPGSSVHSRPCPSGKEAPAARCRAPRLRQSTSIVPSCASSSIGGPRSANAALCRGWASRPCWARTLRS